MKRNISTTFKQKAACLLMLLALLWLTVSIPFVYECQQTIGKEKITGSAAHSPANDNVSSGNPLNNTTEEKNTGTPGSLSEEYLHHSVEEVNHFRVNTLSLHPEHEATYTAFHGELHCPPPNL